MAHLPFWSTICHFRTVGIPDLGWTWECLVQGMCLRNPGIKMMSKWPFDMRTHLAFTSQRTNTKRKEWDTSKLAKEDQGATSEEQSDKWGKTARLGHETPNTSAFSDPCVALEHPVSGETPSRPGSVLVQKSGRVRISASDAFYGTNEPDNRCTGKVFERYCKPPGLSQDSLRENKHI